MAGFRIAGPLDLSVLAADWIDSGIGNPPHCLHDGH
jgi:hypothetical protein